MKKLIFLFLISCGTFIDNRYFVKAQKICEPNGGLKGIITTAQIDIYIVLCNNDLQKNLTPEDLKE